MALSLVAQRDEPVACEACGSVWTPDPEPTHEAPKVARARQLEPRAPRPKRRVGLTSRRVWEREDRVPDCVADLLRLEAAEASASSARVVGSSILGVQLEAMRGLGILGSGCKGTKGIGHAPRPEPRLLAAQPELVARFDALTGQDRAVAEAIRVDGAGIAHVAMVVPGHPTRKPIEMDLSQRVAFRCAPDKRVRAWWGKIAEGDSGPALEGSKQWGEQALRELAGAWFQQTKEA